MLTIEVIKDSGDTLLYNIFTPYIKLTRDDLKSYIDQERKRWNVSSCRVAITYIKELEE